MQALALVSRKVSERTMYPSEAHAATSYVSSPAVAGALLQVLSPAPLRPGEGYFVRARARNGAGFGPFGAVLARNLTSVPDAPVMLSVEPFSASQLRAVCSRLSSRTRGSCDSSQVCATIRCRVRRVARQP